MIAAIDARKSTEQNGVGDDEKSVTRQVEHAKAYAIKKDWTVAEEHVYVAEGSGRARDATGEKFLEAGDPGSVRRAMIR